MSRPLVLGIDPGLSGAAALYSTLAKKLFDVIDLPTHEVGKRTQIDGAKFYLWLSQYAQEIGVCVMEDVGARPGAGVTGMFNFGRSQGIILGVVESLSIPVFYVQPAVWKRQMGVTADKNTSRTEAALLFPDFISHFARKKDDGRAEAALLAKFGEIYLPKTKP